MAIDCVKIKFELYIQGKKLMDFDFDTSYVILVNFVSFLYIFRVSCQIFMMLC